MDKSAALFRISNASIMDYPFEEAVGSALMVADEAVVVVMQSEDDTWNRCVELYLAFPGRVRLRREEFVFDTWWQEKWWNLAVSLTDAEWLFWVDADEVYTPEDAAVIRGTMAQPGIDIISLAFHHYFATGDFIFQTWPGGDIPHRNARLGRRSAGFTMRNRNTPGVGPKLAACNMEYKGGYAHDARGRNVALLDTVTIHHYSFARDPLAVARYQAKHSAWYAGGGGLEDGRIPDVKPHGYRLKDKLASGTVVPYHGEHPVAMTGWIDKHKAIWERVLDSEGIQLGDYARGG